MKLQKMVHFGVLGALLATTSACGVVDKLEAAADAAADAKIDELIAKDPNAVEIVFSTSFTRVFDSVGKTVEEAMGEAETAPTYQAAAGGTPKSGELNATVQVPTGGTVTLTGTYTVTPNDDNTMTLAFDVTADWSDLAVTIATGEILTSGTSTLTGSFTLGGEGEGKGAAGTAAWKGTLKLEDVDLPFDLELTVDGKTIDVTGTINGETYSFDAAKFANNDDNENGNGNGDVSSDASIASITLNHGALDPALSDTVDAYTIDLDAGTSSLDVIVEATSDAATVTLSRTGANESASLSGNTLSPLANGQSYELTIVVTAEDGTTTRTVVLTINVALTEGTLTYATSASDIAMGELISIPVSEATGVDGGTYTIDPALPEGLELDALTGEISGTIAIDLSKIELPTTYTVTVVADSASASVDIDLGVMYKQHFLSDVFPTEITTHNGFYIAVSAACYEFMGSCGYGKAYAEPKDQGKGLLFYADNGDVGNQLRAFIVLPVGNYSFSFYQYSGLNEAHGSGSITPVHVIVTNTEQVAPADHIYMDAANVFNFSVANNSQKLVIETYGTIYPYFRHAFDNFEIKAVAP